MTLVLIIGLLLAPSAYAETCGSANALGDALAFDDAACQVDGEALLANANAANAVCAAGPELFANDPAQVCTTADDKATCCVAQCKTDGAVTDSTCGVGFVYNAANQDLPCASATCDMAVDKDQCCVAQAQCQTDGLVTDLACGIDYVYVL